MTRLRPCSPWNIALLLLLPMLGCNRNFFTVRGQVGTEGPAFGHWAGKPQGCSRDPDDARSDADTRTVATFFWQEPADIDLMRRQHRAGGVRDAPAQFELLHAPGGGYDARMETVFMLGWLIHPSDCSTFQVETHEEGPAFRGGRSTLGGTVRMECRVRSSRVFADFKFSRCEF